MLLLLTACDGGLVRSAKKAVLEELRDPGSATFSGVRNCMKPNAVQGEVNAKNSMGGYGGAKPFYYVDGSVAILDGLSDDDRITNGLGNDADSFTALSKRCWSDEIIRKVEEETKGLS